MIEEPTKLTVKRNRKRPSEAQIAAFQNVPTGFVVDAMFGHGQLDLNISPLGDGRDYACQAAGPALTADNPPGDSLATRATLEFITKGDIVVSAFAGHQGCAASGDRVAGMMKNAGAAGFVTDGPMRDYAGLVEVALPCWCTGLSPGSPVGTGPGRVGLPVIIGGQHVASGDMIVADRDGVVVVPFDEIDRVIAMLEKIAELEVKLDAEVQNGRASFDQIAQLLDSKDTTWID